MVRVIPIPGGGEQLPFVESIPSRTVTATGATSVGNTAFYYRVRVSKPIAVTQASWYVGAAAGNVDAGIGTISGTTFTLLASTGSVAVAGSAVVQSANLSAPVTLAPGVDYYLAFVASTVTTLTLGRNVVTAALLSASSGDVYNKTTELPLTTGVTVTAGTTANLILWVRLS